MTRMVYYYNHLADYGALFTLLVLITMAIACCIWCYCIRAHDKAMQHHIMNLAEKKGINVEPYTLHAEPSYQPHANENCSIYVPDVGIIL